MNLVVRLTECNRNAEIWLQLTVLFPFLSVLWFCFPCLPPFTSIPLFLFPPFLLPPIFNSFFACSFFSLAWNGDWKPPKVWRDCNSQKQPAQQPCKSIRNFLWKGLERPAFVSLALPYHFTVISSFCWREHTDRLLLALVCCDPKHCVVWPDTFLASAATCFSTSYWFGDFLLAWACLVLVLTEATRVFNLLRFQIPHPPHGDSYVIVIAT